MNTDKALKIAIIVGIFITVLSLSYYLVVFIPKKEAKRIEIQKQEKELKEQKEKQEKEEQATQNEDKARSIRMCISGAEANYWDYMKINGTEKTDGTIYADNTYWDRAEKVKNEATDNCYKQYR